MSNDLSIAISGKSGCGNTTVSRLVSEKMNLTLINYTFKTIAVEEGVDFEEICRRAELDTVWDLRVDERQVEMAKVGNCVLGSRLAIWLLENAELKVYLEAGLLVRARRIQEREGGDLEQILVETEERDRRDRARYLNLYSIDINRYDFADAIIDAEKYNGNQIADIITELAREKVGI